MADGAKALVVVNIIARRRSQGKSIQFGVGGSRPTTIFWGRGTLQLVHREMVKRGENGIEALSAEAAKAL